MLDSRSRCSLIRRSLLLLHCHLVFLALLGLNEHFVGLACLGLEVLVVGQQLLEINCLLVEKHTGDGWCILFTVSLVDCLVNVVTNEVASVITLERVKLGNVHLRKLHRRGLLLLLLHLHLLRWHHHLLSRWLLCWHLLLLLLLLLIVHTHWHLLLLLLLLRLMLLVIASSHLTTVVVPCCIACCYACCNVGFHRDLDSFLSKSFRDHHADLHVLGARISSHACSGFHHSDSYPDYDPYIDHRAYQVDQSSIEVYFAFCNIEIRLFID